MVLVDLSLSALELVRLLPQPMPILLGRSASPGTNDLEYVFGWVVLGSALEFGALAKVVDERLRIVPDLAEVDRLSALLEQEETIKYHK